MANRVFDLEAVVSILTGKAETSLRNLEQTARTTGDEIEETFTEAGDSASDALGGVEQAGKKSGEGIAGAFSAASTQLMKMAGGAVLGALGAAITAVGATALQTGRDLIDAMARFQAETGASRADAQAFGDTIRDLWQNNTDGIDAIAGALTSVRRQFGDLGDDTQQVTQTLMDFAKVTGTDNARAADLAANAMRQWNLEISQMPGMLDAVNTVSQQTGAQAERLLGGLTATAPVVQSLGLSFQETAAFMGLLERSGAGAEAANESLVMLMQASINTTEAQAQAFRTLGIEVDATTGKPIGGAAQVFRTLLAEMEKGSIQGERLTAALSIVGTEAGKKLIGALKGAEGGFAALAQAASESSGSVAAASESFDKQIGDRLTLLFRKTFGRIGVDLGKFVSEMVEPAFQKMEELANADIFADFTGWLEQNLPAASAMFEQLMDTVQALGDLVQRFFARFSDESATTATTMLDFLLATFIRLSTAALNIIGTIGEFVDSFVGGLQVITTGVGAAVGSISTAWSSMVDGMKGLWSNFMDEVNNLWVKVIDNILAAIQALPGQLRGAMEETERSLLQTRHALMTRDRPQHSAAENLGKITSAPSIVGDAVGSAIQGERQRQAADEAIANLSRSQFMKAEGKGRANPNEFVGPPVPDGFVPPPPPPNPGEDIAERIEDLERALSLEKITKEAAVEKYQAILAEAQKAKLSDEELYKIEKALFDLQGDITKRVEDEAAKRQQVNNKLQIEYLRAVKGEKDALLEALKQEKAARAEAGANSMQLEAWYASQRAKIIADDIKRTEELAAKEAEANNTKAQEAMKMEQALLEAKGQTFQAALVQLRAERDALIANGADKLKAEELYQAQKAKLEQDYAKQRESAEADLQQKTLELEGKGAEAAAQAKLQAISRTVAAAREAGVSEAAIARYIAAEQKKALEDVSAARDAAKAQEQTSPVQTLQQAFSQGMFANFSVGGKTGADPSAVKAANQLASDIGALGTPAAPGDAAAIESVITIRLVDQKGHEIGAGSASSSDAASNRDMAFSYTPGRF